jgi:ABC-2 type transport system permease protein
MNLAYLILHEIESKVEYNSLEIGTSIADELLVSLSSLRNSLIKEKEELSELKDNSDKIDSIVTSIDEEPEIGTKLTKLKEVKNSLNSSTETSKINDAINLIEDYEEYSSSASSSFYQISVNNDKSLELLDTAIKRIDELVNSINSNKIENAEEIISPIKTNITSVNEDSNNLYNVLPTIISLIALFGGILLSASFILKERKTKAYFRNFMTPTINFTFLLANYFTCLFVLIFQFLLVFAGLYFIFGILVPIGNGEFFVSLLLSLSVFLLIGTFIGYLFKTEESIIFAAVLVASLMMFFSNTLLPIETFSSSLKTIAKFNPFVISDFMLRKLMIFNYGYKEILFEIYLLSGFATLFLVLSLLWRKFTKKIL